MNFPAAEQEHVLLWATTFYYDIPVKSTPGFSDNETQNNFRFCREKERHHYFRDNHTLYGPTSSEWILLRQGGVIQLHSGQGDKHTAAGPKPNCFLHPTEGRPWAHSRGGRGRSHYRSDQTHGATLSMMFSQTAKQRSFISVTQDVFIMQQQGSYSPEGAEGDRTQTLEQDCTSVVKRPHPTAC